jgi:hypothetical protein
LGGTPKQQDRFFRNVSAYAGTYALRDVEPPPPASEKPQQPQSIPNTFIPYASFTPSGTTIIGAGLPTRWDRWPGQAVDLAPRDSQRLNVKPVALLFSSTMVSYDLGDASGSFSRVLTDYLDLLARIDLQKTQGVNFPIDWAAYAQDGQAFVNSIRLEYFDDRNFGNVSGNGQLARGYLLSGQFDKFFELLNQNPKNPVAAELREKGIASSFQWSRTELVGSTHFVYDPGKGLKARIAEDDYLFNVPGLFLGPFSGTINFFDKDLHVRSIQYKPDPSQKPLISDPIDTARRYLEFWLRGSFLVKIPEAISFYVQPGISYGQVPGELIVTDQRRGKFDIKTSSQLGWSLDISNTHPYTGDSFDSHRKFWDFTDNPIKVGTPDLRILLLKEGADPLLAFTDLSLRNKFQLTGSPPDPEHLDLGSFTMFYLESSLVSQWRGGLPSQNILLFVPTIQYVFGGSTAVALGTQAGYDFSSGRGARGGVRLDAYLFRNQLQIGGGLDWINGNFSGKPRWKVNVGWTPLP